MACTINLQAICSNINYMYSKYTTTVNYLYNKIWHRYTGK